MTSTDQRVDKSLDRALAIIADKTGVSANQVFNQAAKAASEGISVSFLKADDNSRPDYPITPIPFPDLRGRYNSVRQFTGALYDKNGKMRLGELNTAIHGANYYPKLYEYALGLYEENERLKQRIAELEQELEN